MEPTTDYHTWLSFDLLGLGISVLGASLYADTNEIVGDQWVDFGVFVGVLAVLLSIALYWLV